MSTQTDARDLDVVTLITARGNSKSIPQKNIVLLAGKPLIAWSIEAARKSHAGRRVLVSTDDPTIARTAVDWGAEIPFQRPAELAGDTTPHIDVVVHALDWLKEYEGRVPEYLLLLQPTSPFRTFEDINAALDIARVSQADSVVSVCEAGTHPYLAKKIDAEGCLSNFVESGIAYLRRQDLPSAYVLNGSIYLTRSRILLEERTFHPKRTVPYVMPAQRSMDIDEPWDLHLARLILEDKARTHRAA